RSPRRRKELTGRENPHGGLRGSFVVGPSLPGAKQPSGRLMASVGRDLPARQAPGFDRKWPHHRNRSHAVVVAERSSGGSSPRANRATGQRDRICARVPMAITSSFVDAMTSILPPRALRTRRLQLELPRLLAQSAHEL